MSSLNRDSVSSSKFLTATFQGLLFLWSRFICPTDPQYDGGQGYFEFLQTFGRDGEGRPPDYVIV